MASPDILIGWKAIARYLNRSPRTVQRWARLKGLPVSPLPKPYSSCPYIAITKSMIDTWLLSMHRDWHARMSHRE